MKKSAPADAKPRGKPAQNELSASKSTLYGFVVLAGILCWSYFPAIAGLVHRWANEADYSHGFFVPAFSVFLLWHRREMLNPFPSKGNWLGIVLIVFSGLLRWAAAYFHFQLLDPFSLIPCLAGIALVFGGWQAIRWSWPAIAFLVFMIPLPGFISGILSHPLQRIATISSVYILQTIGIPAIDQGNVIWLTEGKIGVVEACSGIRMLLVFFAITVGASFVVKRPLWEKLLIAVSAVAIAVLANVIRIAATGVAYESGGQELADMIFHDLAGWLMMPLAMLILGFELFILSKLFIETPKGPIQID